VYSLSGEILENVTIGVVTEESEYQVPINLEKLQNGLYLLKLRIGDYSGIIKMSVIK
jgi:hypothetical protein